MKQILAASLLAITLSAAPALAKASDAGETATTFGLVGVWAHVDCARPADGTNDHEIWALEADGSLSETDDGGFDYKTYYHYTQAQIIGEDRISVDGVYLGDNHLQHVVLVKQGDKQRVYESKDASTGQMLIIDGIFVNGGAHTDWYTKCG